MRELSDDLLGAIFASDSPLVLVPIVKLEHDDWAEPVLLVNDTVELTHGGETYQPFPFEMTLPDDEDEGFPVLRWSCSNVSRALIGQFRALSGEVRGTVTYVLTNAPDVAEVGPLEVELTGISYDAQTISGVLTIEPILQEAFTFKMMTPGNAPGLF